MSDKTWLEALLEQEEHRRNKDLQRQVWKARHQRKLTDEEIAYFLRHCDRWDLLTHYACYFRKAGRTAEAALAALVQDFHLDANSRLANRQVEDGDRKNVRFMEEV